MSVLPPTNERKNEGKTDMVVKPIILRGSQAFCHMLYYTIVSYSCRDVLHWDGLYNTVMGYSTFSQASKVAQSIFFGLLRPASVSTCRRLILYSYEHNKMSNYTWRRFLHWGVNYELWIDKMRDRNRIISSRSEKCDYKGAAAINSDQIICYVIFPVINNI